MKSGIRSRQSAELHELKAGLLENLGARNLAKRLLQHAVGAPVTVVVRLAEHFAALGQQDVIDAPGVGADGDDLLSVRLRRQAQAVLDFVPEADDVPAHRIRQQDRSVREAVHFLQPDLLPVPDPRDDPSALRPEIHTEIHTFRHDPILPRGRAPQLRLLRSSQRFQVSGRREAMNVIPQSKSPVRSIPITIPISILVPIPHP
jgi:hypothetical protein